MSEWISVKDRLPEVGVEVLVWLGGQKKLDFPGQSRMTTAVFSVTQWFGTRRGEDILGDVTHWQPLPAPPESEEEMSEKLPPVERSAVGSGTNFRSKTVNPQM